MLVNAKSIAVVLASSVVAASANSLPHARGLFARQFADPDAIPPACQPACAPVEATISTCQDLSCLCTNDVAAEIAACANCLIGVGDSVAANQEIIDQYTNACITSGAPITSIQVSSVPPGLSTSAPEPTTTITTITTSTPTTPPPPSTDTDTDTAAPITDLNPTGNPTDSSAGAGETNAAAASVVVTGMFGVREAVGAAIGMVFLSLV